MGELIAFDRDCTRCGHLVQLCENTYVCMKRVHMDDSDVIPIKDGEKTEDWYICDGNNFTLVSKSHSRAN